MKYSLLILTAIILSSCGYKEEEQINEFKIKQEISGKFLQTMIKYDKGDIFQEIVYYDIVEIDSITNAKKEYEKAEKILKQYKKVKNEIHNINK